MKNSDISAAFREIGKSLELLGGSNDFRIKAYFRAAQQIDLIPESLCDVVNGGEAYFKALMLKHRNIGDRSQIKIWALCKTGTCQDLEEVRATMRERNLTLPSELSAPGNKAPRKTDRKASKNLREEVNAVRRPWEQADEVVKQVMPIILAHFDEAMVCGSYRRKLATVKDIDIAVSTAGPPAGIQDIFSAILKELGVTDINVIKKGEAQVSFYIGSPNGDWQVDIWFVEKSSFGAAILFATGCADFNVQMRGWLKARGMKLNRYGLYEAGKTPEEDILLASATEEGIFRALGLEFVPPEERISFDAHRKVHATEEATDSSGEPAQQPG